MCIPIQMEHFFPRRDAMMSWNKSFGLSVIWFDKVIGIYSAKNFIFNPSWHIPRYFIFKDNMSDYAEKFSYQRQYCWQSWHVQALVDFDSRIETER
jgi:hypothetical protein